MMVAPKEATGLTTLTTDPAKQVQAQKASLCLLTTCDLQMGSDAAHLMHCRTCETFCTPALHHILLDQLDNLLMVMSQG